MANGVVHKKEVLNYRQIIQHPTLGNDWNLLSANEFGRLAQGIGGRLKGINTLFFINKSEVPPERFKDVTYGKFVCMLHPEKEYQNRTRLKVGGNCINYPDEVGTPIAGMLLVKTN